MSIALKKIIFSIMIISFSALHAEVLTFVNERKNTGYSIENGVLERLTSSVDIKGVRRWFKVAAEYRIPMKVVQKDASTYVVKWSSGIITEYVDDSGTEYYMHKVFKVSEDSAFVTESSRFEAFSGDLIAPSLEEWSKRPFQSQETYTVLKD